MGGIFSYDNPIMSAISKIANCILLNMLFLICCIPIVTAGASFTAMYYTVEKILKITEDMSVVPFLHHLKKT